MRQQMGTYYNKKRSKGLDLKEGDKVFLLTKFLRIKRLSKKLDFKRVRLFRIIKKVVNSNYKLLLPNTIKVRSKVFYISLLELILAGVRLEISARFEDEEEEEYEVEEIRDLRLYENKLQYLIK